MNSKRYSETWFVKRTSNSEPEKVVLFFKDELFANVSHSKAVEKDDARIMFGSNFPKQIANCWQ